jgi:hypothetical protein
MKIINKVLNKPLIYYKISFIKYKPPKNIYELSLRNNHLQFLISLVESMTFVNSIFLLKKSKPELKAKS